MTQLRHHSRARCERPVPRRLEELEMFVLTKLNGGLTPPQRVAALEEATVDY